MRRFGPDFTIAALVLALAVAMAAALGACADLGSQNDSTTFTAAVTQTSTATDDQERLPADYILFRDDFQDGDSEGWRVSGAWVVQQDSDLYTFDTTGQGYAFVPAGVSWGGDYAFKSSYTLTSGILAFSFNATSGGRYYVPIDQQRISLVKEDAAGEKTVLTQAQAPEIGALHYLTIAKQNGTIQVYVDRTLWLSAQDSSPLTVGTVAVGSTDGTTASVDNVLVNKIVRTLPQGTPAVAAVAEGQVLEPADDGADLGDLPAPGDDAPDLPDNNQGQDLPEPEVYFTANSSDDIVHTEAIVVPADRLLTLVWTVQNANGVFLDGTPKPLEGSVSMGPEEVYEHTYELEVLALDGRTLTYYMAVTVEGGGQDGAHGPDLSIACRVEVEEGTRVLVSLQLSNIGDEDAQATFRWYANESDSQSTRSSTVSLAAGESTTIQLGHDYGQSGTMHWKATIKTQPEGLDIDTGNNSDRGTVTLTQ